jgi:hypothetical protein
MVSSTKPSAISLEEKFDSTEEDLRDKFEIPEDGLADEEEEVKVDFRLTKYIKVFDDALPPMYCDKIVDMFRKDADNHVPRNADGQKFVSLNLDHNSSVWENISVTQRKIVESTMPVYAKSVAAHMNCFPEHSVLEDFYVYQFRDSKDVKEVGVDISNYAQARRYLTMIWFLTDDEDFQLGFFDVQNTVSAKKGRLIMFPSTWTYPYSIGNFQDNENFLLKTHITLP